MIVMQVYVVRKLWCYMIPIKSNHNLFGDNIAFVEEWDFSAANTSHQSRIDAVTQVASVCYGNTKVIGSSTLYNKLEQESLGLPSSAFEFVPVLLPYHSVFDNWVAPELPNVLKFGEPVEHEDYLWVLSNLRAMLADGFDTEFFNTPEEVDIIRKYFKVYRSKIDLNTRSQLVRHRTNYQELSRRYVSGQKQQFEFYIPEDYPDQSLVRGIYQEQVALYEALLVAGVKKEQARRVIPQAAYTTIWHGWQPRGLQNFINLRTSHHAQREIRWLATQMKEWLE